MNGDNDLPTGAELLEAVASFLRDEIVPSGDGRIAFLARVAANAVEIVRREMELEPALEQAAQARLEGLLGHGGPLESLNRELCERIEGGELTLETPGLSRFLWETTLRKVEIDQPRYSGYRRAVEDKSEEA